MKYSSHFNFVQWEECGNFSKKVRMFVRANERPEEGKCSLVSSSKFKFRNNLSKFQLFQTDQSTTEVLLHSLWVWRVLPLIDSVQRDIPVLDAG